MDEKSNPGNYWRTWAFALQTAIERAREDGIRYRVQRVTWQPALMGGRWYLAPTPAPAPSGVAVEPCS